MFPCLLSWIQQLDTTSHLIRRPQNMQTPGSIITHLTLYFLTAPLSAAVVLRFSAYAVVNNSLSATLPKGPSVEKAVLLVIPAVCTLAAAPGGDRERLHRSREAAEHPHPPRIHGTFSPSSLPCYLCHLSPNSLSRSLMLSLRSALSELLGL